VQLTNTVSKTELANVKTLIPLPAFLSATESIYDPGRTVVRIAKYVVGRPLWWALESLGVVGEDEGVREGDVRWWGDYVVVSLLERAADAVEKRQRSNAAIGPGGSLYTTTSFRKEFGDALEPGLEVMSEVDAMVLIRCLERDRNVVVVDGEVRCPALCCMSHAHDPDRLSNSFMTLTRVEKSLPWIEVSSSL
jgi:charged multivesicular body protein 7